MTKYLLMITLGVFAAPGVWAQATSAPPATPAAAMPSAAPPASPPADPNYIIGPGDVLQIFVWRSPELSVSVPVRPDGRISTPLVEDMGAVGKTPTQLARDIEKVLSEYVRTPLVNVIVNNAVSTYSQVKVIGQVKTPQALPYREGMRVLDVILAVGGLTDFAAPNRAEILRTVDGKQEKIHVKLKALMNGGDLDQNIELHAGDVFVIPESRF